MRLGTRFAAAARDRWPASRAALSAVVTIGLSLASLTACNTIAGAGRDIEAAGKALSTQAEKTEDEL